MAMNTTNNMSAINILSNLTLEQQEAVLIWVGKQIFQSMDNYEVVGLENGLNKAYIQAYDDGWKESGIWVTESVRSNLVDYWVKELLGKDTDGDSMEAYQLQCETTDEQTIEEWLKEDTEDKAPERERFCMAEIVSAVLDGANDVTRWWSGNHSLGFYNEDGNWVDVFTTTEEFEMMDAIVNSGLKISLSKKQENNLKNIIHWLIEDNVEIVF